MGQNPVGRYRIVFFAVIVLASGIAMTVISSIYLSAMSLCKNYNNSEFGPNATVSVTCPIVRDVGQDLTFRARFYAAGASSPDETIKIPAHLEIRDPNNSVLYDANFDDRIVLSFKPKTYGEYTAIITNLEDKDKRSHSGYTEIHYALGFLSYPDVSNPVANSLNVMAAAGNLVLAFGAIFVIISIIKAATKRKNSFAY